MLAKSYGADRRASKGAGKENRTSDLIDRQAALNALTDAVKSVGVLDADDIKTVFDALPSVQPEKTQLSQQGTTKDAISRRAALEKVRTMQTYKLFMGDDMILVDKAGVQTELMMLPPAQPEPQWIPVERELPEDYTDVLVWFEYFRYGDYNCLYQTHGIGTYVANYNSWTVNHESGWKDLRVIAWIPLPKPYEGEGEQE